MTESARPVLVVRTPGGLRREFHLVSDSVIAGRDPDCDLVLDSRQVSRQHARIESGRAGRMVIDCESTNGTYVNGTPVHASQVLSSGDVIALGDVFLTYIEQGAEGLQAALDSARNLLDSAQPALRKNALWVIDDVIECAGNLGDTITTERAITAKMAAMDPASASDETGGGLGTTIAIGRPDLRALSDPVDRVAVMITDIEDSTPMTTRLGDERWLEFLRDYSSIVRRCVSAHGGFEVKSTGDGSMIVFHDAEGAVRAAIEMQRGFDAYDHAEMELGLRVRIGIHQGEVIREGDDFFGKAVVIATRVTSSAAGSEILVSEAVEQTTRRAPDIKYGARRTVTLKGLSGQHAVVPVLW